MTSERPEGSDPYPTRGVNVVAAPIRYPRTPLLMLLVIGILPAIALVWVYRWSDAEAERYDDSRAAVDAVDGAIAADPDATDPAGEGGGQPAAGTAVPPRVVTAPLDVSVLSVRRAPGEVAELGSVNRLRTQLDPLWTFVGDGSCAAVSVDGVATNAKNASTPVIPASVLKLVTASVALEVLGEDHVYTTTVAGPSPVDGVVAGDLYLVGGGDPLLTSSDYPVADDLRPVFNPTSFDALADAVVAAGVTRIDGAVIGDGLRYDDEFVVDSWADGIAFVDAGPYDALMANDSRVVGSSSRQSDPSSAAAREFVRLLSERGVSVGRGSSAGAVPADLPVIASVDSAPLPSVIEEMLVNSDNNTAEMMLKEIGFVARGEGTRVAGLNVVDATLRGAGLPMEGVRIVDGSGLSASNRLTCAMVLALLQREADGVLPGLLPVAGETGTLSEEFGESPMAGRLAAKTGTLNNPPVEEDPPAAKSLAGYVSTPTEATIEFVMILNTPDVTLDRKFAPMWSQMGLLFDTYPEGPTPADIAPR